MDVWFSCIDCDMDELCGARAVSGRIEHRTKGSGFVIENGSVLNAGWSLISGGALFNQLMAWHDQGYVCMDLRFEVKVATKFPLKMCGSRFSDQLTCLESSRPLCGSRQLPSTESQTSFVDTILSALLSLAPKGVNASPILTESGRNPRRFEIEPALLADDNLVAIASMDMLEVSSVMPRGSVLLIAGSVILSRANIFLRFDAISARLGVVTSWRKAVGILVLLGEPANAGDILCAVGEILLTIFMRVRGEDQLLSSLLRLGTGGCDVVGVVGTGGIGL